MKHLWRGRIEFERLLARVSDEELQQALRVAYAEVEQMALTDRLTGCANRQYFEQWWLAGCAEGQKVAFLLIDVDQFKTVNDRWGHPVGDQVLIHMAERLRSGHWSEPKMLIRYGGDEFLLVLLEKEEATLAESVRTFESRVVAVAERLRQDVREQRFDVELQSVHITISIGVLCLGDDVDQDLGDTGFVGNPEQRPVARYKDERWQSYFTVLDQALYDAKRAGRDRIMVATMPASSEIW